MPRSSHLASLLLCALLGGCEQPSGDTFEPRGPSPEFTPTEAQARRLTARQYLNALGDVFGSELDLPSLTSLEPDERVDGLYAVGASVVTVSSWGVEQYELAAFEIAEQVMTTPQLREPWMVCEPAGSSDDDCAEQVLDELGYRLWRRDLTQEELDRLVDVAALASDTTGDFYQGLSYAASVLLQSPKFLYHIGEGSLGEDGVRRYTDQALAERLALFLWNSLPDAELLELASSGELHGDEVIRGQIQRMLEDPRARRGLRDFFEDMLHLDDLDSLTKDPNVYPHISEQVGPSAREETLAGIEHLVFEAEDDYRELFTTQRSFVDRTLASIYDVQAPEREGFGEIWLDETRGRRGLLGQVSFLALQAHPVSTSATRRGEYVREVLLCQTIPTPPADVDTSIPEVSEDAKTLRERVAVHLQDPTCASCHTLTDPIGLGLENFDGIGRWRTHENDALIDTTGELDGEAFQDAWELGQALSDHPSLGDCLTRTLFQFATGSVPEAGMQPLVDWHSEGFVNRNFSVLKLLEDIAAGPAFRRVQSLEMGETE